MIPAANSAGVAIKTAQPVAHHTAQRAAQQVTAETTKASAGETSAANVSLQTSKAVTAPEQTAVAPRLRDQETAERTERSQPAKDAPTGPPPSFEESPLERQARVMFDPPDLPIATERDAPEIEPVEPADTDQPESEGASKPVAAAPKDPPPTPTERAEASFAETKTMAEPKEPATVDVEL